MKPAAERMPLYMMFRFLFRCLERLKAPQKLPLSFGRGGWTVLGPLSPEDVVALLRLAVRNLRRNRRRTAITLAALIIGVAVLIGIRGFILGIRDMMLGNQNLGALGAIQVHKKGYVENVLSAPLTLDMEDSPALRAAIASVPGVTAVTPRIEFGAQLATPDRHPPRDDATPLPLEDQGKTTFLIMTAMDPATEVKVTPRRWEWVSAARGKMFDVRDEALVVLNDDFARGLGLLVLPPGAPLPPLEQQLALLAPDRDGSLNGENVVLAGTVASATPNDRRVGLMPLKTAQRLLRMEGRVTEYGVAVERTRDLGAMRDAIAARLGSEYEVHTWEQRLPFVRDIVDTQDLVYGIVTVIFMLVVLLGIVNAMLMSVLERVREIGTMLAVGMKRLQVVQLFVAEGLVLGAIGGAVGLLLGVSWVMIMNRIGILIPAPGASVDSIVRPDIAPLFVVRVFAQATVGAMLAALWPAWHAARLRPVEALSHP